MSDEAPAFVLAYRVAIAVSLFLLGLSLFFVSGKLERDHRELQRIEREQRAAEQCRIWEANLTRAAATVILAPQDPETHGAFSTLSANPPAGCVGA